MRTRYQRKGMRTRINMVGFNCIRLFPKSGDAINAPAELTSDPSEWIASKGNQLRLLTSNSFFLSLTSLSARSEDAIIRMAVRDGLCEVETTYSLRKGTEEELGVSASCYEELARKLGWKPHDLRMHSYFRPNGEIVRLSSMTNNERTLHIDAKLRETVRPWAPGLEDPVHVLAAHYAGEEDNYDGISWVDPGDDHPTFLIHPTKADRWRVLAAGERIQRTAPTMYLTDFGEIRNYRAWPEDVMVTEDDVDVDLTKGPDPLGYLKSYDENTLFSMKIDADALMLGEWHWTDAVKMRDVLRAQMKPRCIP